MAAREDGTEAAAVGAAGDEVPPASPVDGSAAAAAPPALGGDRVEVFLAAVQTGLASKAALSCCPEVKESGTIISDIVSKSRRKGALIKFSVVVAHSGAPSFKRASLKL